MISPVKNRRRTALAVVRVQVRLAEVQKVIALTVVEVNIRPPAHAITKTRYGTLLQKGMMLSKKVFCLLGPLATVDHTSLTQIKLLHPLYGFQSKCKCKTFGASTLPCT